MMLLPSTLDARVNEEALLAICLNNESCFYDVLSAGVKPADFSTEGFKLIFEAALKVFQKNQPVNAVTVEEMVKQMTGEDHAYALSGLHCQGYHSDNIYLKDHIEVVLDRSKRRRLADCGNHIFELAADITCEDYSKLSQDLIYNVTSLEQGQQLTTDDYLQQGLDDLLESIQNPEKIRGLTTGYASLDNILSGLRAGTLTILAARPSMGKTTFALNLLVHTAITLQKPSLIFSLEMSGQQLSESLIRIVSQSFRDIEKMKQAKEALSKSPMVIAESSSLNVGALKARAKKELLQHGQLGVIIVDYLQLMSEDTTQNRTQELSIITRQLKNLARELNTPIIALSQLSRGVESRNDKRPILSDLRDSGAIEQDADYVLFLHREDYYNPESTKKGFCEVLIRKNRFGPQGSCNLLFNRSIGVFMEQTFSSYHVA